MIKKENGITLIALIVSIIVILIIAGVAVNTLTGNNGIIQRTISSKEKSEIAQGREETNLLASSYATDYYSKTAEDVENYETTTIADYLANKLNGKKAGDWDVSVSEKIVTISKLGKTATGVIEANGTITWNLDSANSEKGAWRYGNAEKTTVTDGTVTLNLGDYVQYNPTTGATKMSETSYSTENGYQDQTFELSRLAVTEGVGWKVLGVDEEKGQILLVSDTTVGAGDSNYFYLVGKNGYKNGISELNKICALYGQGKYAAGARSITVEDINAITGYVPEDEKYGEGDVHEYGNEVTYYWDGSNYPYYEGTKNTAKGNLVCSHSSGFNWFNNSTKGWLTTLKDTNASSTNKSEITTLKNTDYYYIRSSKLATDSEEYKLIFKSNVEDTEEGTEATESTGSSGSVGSTNLKYWLGSSCVNTDSNAAVFGLRYVPGGGVDRMYLASSYGVEYGGSYGVRPLVYLQSDVSLSKSQLSGDFVKLKV